MLELPNRTIEIKKAVRQQVPLWIGLYGPSGGGKTFTALTLARGIQQVQGGPIYGIDTEAKRMLHYADQFQFDHVEFGEPYGSLDYLAMIKGCLAHNKTGKRPTVIIDSMSHEHEGVGGMLSVHDAEVVRMATWNGEFDPKKAERVKMLAWGLPKAKRRALINGMLNLEANFILCFRAKESSVPVQVVSENAQGRKFTKTEVVNQGFVPIGGDDFVYECTLAALLMPGARGVPTWHSQMVGEARMIKLPEQFKDLPDLGQKPLDVSVGVKLATWADNAPPAKASKPANAEEAEARAREWADWFKDELNDKATTSEVSAFEAEHERALGKMATAHPNLRRELADAVTARLTAIDMED
jgi:hypothetical protein